MSDLVQTKPTGKPRRKEQTAYGFVPAIELRHEFSRAGELVEVNARGEIVNRWSVVRNDHVCVMMKDRTIVLPKGFPIMAAQLIEAEANVKVHPYLTEAVELAHSAFGGVDYV